MVMHGGTDRELQFESWKMFQVMAEVVTPGGPGTPGDPVEIHNAIVDFYEHNDFNFLSEKHRVPIKM